MKKELIIGTIIMLILATFTSVSGINNENEYDGQPKNEPITIDWWPMYAHDLKNTASTTDLGPTSDLYAYKWIYTASNDVGDACVFNNKAYFGSLDNKVYCVYSNNGSKIWDFTTGDDTYYPTSYNENIYVGSKDNNIYCLNANNGSEIWRYTTNGAVTGLAVYDNKVYSGSWDYNVYCLDANTGDLIWTFTTGYSVIFPPAIDDDKIIIPSYDSKVYCLDAQGNGDGTTTELWSTMISGNIWAAPSIYEDNIYIDQKANLICLNLSTGVEKWSYQPPSIPIDTMGILFDGMVYIGAGQYFYCLDAVPDDNGDGIVDENDNDEGLPNPGQTYDLIWRYTFPTIVKSSIPALAGGKIYVSISGYLYCIDAEGNGDGTTDTTFIWSISFLGGNPVIVDNKIFMGSGTKMRCYIENHRPETPDQPEPDSGSIVGNVGDNYWFKVEKVSDPDGDDIYYLFNWDDGSDSGWLGPYASGDVGTVLINHIWVEEGDYSIKVKTKDIYGLESEDWSEPLEFTVNAHPPETPMTPLGPFEGEIEIDYSFSTMSTDPHEEDEIYYMWEWGDNTPLEWIGPYQNGETIHVNHNWSSVGYYLVKVKAKDNYNDSTGIWSEPRIIHITQPETPPEPIIRINLITGGINKVGANVRNIGEGDAVDISWEIKVTGGLLGRIDVSANGSIDQLSSLEEIKISTASEIQGLGIIDISITVDEIEKTGIGFVLGKLVFVLGQ